MIIELLFDMFWSLPCSALSLSGYAAYPDPKSLGIPEVALH